MTTYHGRKACPLPFLDIVWAEQELEWGSGIWASAHNALRTTVLDAVHPTDTYLSMVKRMYDKAFQAEDPLKIQRFSSLRHLLENELLPASHKLLLPASQSSQTWCTASSTNTVMR